MPELVINVSNIISPLCYTVLKLEPYTSCPFRCIYCYSRWYMKRPTDTPYPRLKAVGMFRDVVKKIRRKGLKPIPFRLATLVDPFPPVEQLYRITEKILAIAIDYEYPIIINTKSVFYTHENMKKLLLLLMDRGLAVLQISISTLDNRKAEIIEPRAPYPEKRLRVLNDIGSTDAPLVLRLSPYIPFISPTTHEEIEEFSNLCKELGVKHVVVESLRLEQGAIDKFLEVLGIKNVDVDVEEYSLRKIEGMKPLVKISRRFGETVYRIYADKLTKKGIAFTTCKEGLFEFHTAPDCCAAYLLKDFILRYTLYDLYRYAKEVGLKISLPVNLKLINDVCSKFSRLHQPDFQEYPRTISKGLKYHEKKLLKVLQNIDLLKHVASSMLNVVEIYHQISG